MLRKTIKNKKGLTLVEVAVSIALIAIVSITMVLGFGALGGLVRQSVTVRDEVAQLSAEVATPSTAASQVLSSYSIRIEGVTISGNLVEYTLPEADVGLNFVVFETE
ncbi:prepilin-type N-terminal cleavage/methylation domain-containing protein [Eubacteriales bacterium OttesenSCG-928-K08]|nr:prepilin-type N-terminal cleavage/methylation domain-containing protein [Eubacteriales bacterium OttesenSCG-928-K08]